MGDFFVDKNIAKAKTINTLFYKSEDYFQKSKEKIFAASWQFIGDKDKVPRPNSGHPFILLENYLNEPLLLTNDKEGSVRCISNVCTHRGNLLVHESCNLKQIGCKYHGRQFSLDGKFLSMPQFKEVENFPCEDDNLQQVQLFEWGKLLFASLEPKIPVNSCLEEMMERWRGFL